MIYTVTLNPSIDYIVQVSDMELGKLNKMDNDLKLPGGKGINVSRVLHALQMDTVALGFLGGFTGDFIRNWLEKDKLKTNFISIQDDTRINIKLKSKKETEINGRGPDIQGEEAKQLLHLFSNFQEEDVVVLSGSKPPSLPNDFYLQIINKITQTNSKFVIDTTGKDLKDALPYKPFLVKPNKEELEELFDVKLTNRNDIIQYGKKLHEQGAQHVIVSMAGEGAILITRDAIYKGISPKGTVKNSVGAGDSMIAGFIGNYTKTKDVVNAFQMGLASGSATAFSNDLATKEEITQLLNKVVVEKL